MGFWFTNRFVNDLSTVILGLMVWQQCKEIIEIFFFETFIQHTGKATFQDFRYVNSAEHDLITATIRGCHRLFAYRKALFQSNPSFDCNSLQKSSVSMMS